MPDLDFTTSVFFEALRFLNPSFRRWQIWLLVSARAGDLTRSIEADGTDSLSTLDAGGRFATLDDEGVQIETIAPVSVPASAVDADAGILLRGVLTASPGPLPLTFVVEDLNALGTGAWIQDTINVPAIGGLPQLSDIAVAQRTGGTWTRDGVAFLQVSPVHITNPDGGIHTYFEAYGVRQGTRYAVDLRLVPVEAAERIWQLEPEDLAFQLQFTADMTAEIGRHHLRLDLSDTEPGAYTLAVRIQDEDSGAYSLPAMTPIVVVEE